MAAIDRTKWMDAEEVRQLRTVTEAWAILDLQAGRLRGPLVWAVVDTALRTGLRVSELAALTVGDLDTRRCALKVRRAKRRKPVVETLALGKELTSHLAEFVQWKATVGQSTDKIAGLFIGKRGTALTPQGMMQLWKVAVARAGLPKELSIHSARHTVAVDLLRETGNLRQVQKQLGHASPVTTAAMYADVSFEDMGKGIDALYTDDGDEDE